MAATQLTAESKEALRKTIRDLRPRLIRGVLEATRIEYRLDRPVERAELPEVQRCRRERLEQWLKDRGGSARDSTNANESTEDSLENTLSQAIKAAMFTWVNRLVMLRILEHHGLVRHTIVAGGCNCPADGQDKPNCTLPLEPDGPQDYRVMLEVAFADLAVDLPGLFGRAELEELIPIPAALLHDVVGALNEVVLDSAWGDDMTLGWVYQYWNDPERERLDAKITSGGKIETHEIACKTQMFTERYMVEWLLENSLGFVWLCICEKNGWSADATAELAELAQWRAEVCNRSQRGDWGLDATMPSEIALEGRWKYYVTRPLTDEAIEQAPYSIRDVKILEPACGSGHFLISAFSALVVMYREEARHRGEVFTDEAIASDILARNLHGIDIDVSAVQVAAAALWLKAKLLTPRAKLAQMNLVVPCFRIAELPEDAPAIVRLHVAMGGLGVNQHKVDMLIESLANVQHLGTLFRIDRAIAALLDDGGAANNADPAARRMLQRPTAPGDDAATDRRREIELVIAEFLTEVATETELGVRCENQHLTMGLQFVRLLGEGAYDVVIGNPPYLGTQRLADSRYIDTHYLASKEDLYGAFIERSLQLLRPSGLASLVTIRSWMYVSHFRTLREQLLDDGAIRVLADLGLGGFDTVPGVESAMVVLCGGQSSTRTSIALGATREKKSNLILQSDKYEFDGKLLRRIEGCPVIYQWARDYLLQYLELPKLGAIAPARVGMKTSDNTRFVRAPWEVRPDACDAVPVSEPRFPSSKWIPYIKGAEGKTWIEPLCNLVLWENRGLEIRLALNQAYGQGPQCERQYFVPGVAFTTIARRFLARAHRFRSIFDVAGSSVFHADSAGIVCLLNSARARTFVESVNPTINFQVGDVNRLPVVPIANARDIFSTLEAAFAQHESCRETSIEFKCPGLSAWRYAQDWAQRAVDRPENTPLPAYEPQFDVPQPEAEVSFAIGVAMGRLGARGEGILTTPPETSIPHGILFVGPGDIVRDSLTQPATQCIVIASNRHHDSVWKGKQLGLRDWLRREFFSYHRTLYENRPIYLPLSSRKRNFVAWVSIHRFTENTLQTVVTEHLRPALHQLDVEIARLTCVRNSAEKAAVAAADRQNQALQRLRVEVTDFIAIVLECAERGAPPAGPKCPSREADAPFQMDLNDGVMINSAALWPLLESQWKDPRKWWQELCVAQGRKDYDWARLARRYFPTRVEEKCARDPSLALGHGCLWRHHPAVAYAWELRMQSGDGTECAISDTESERARKRYLQANAAQSAAIRQQESMRRDRREAKAYAG